MIELSILVPARQEMFLKETVQDLLKNCRAETEIVVILDGAWADPPLDQHERVTVVYNPVSIGQRAACNQAAKLARGKYVAKIDAHCAVKKGFDREMLGAFKEVGDNVTMTATMRNLHVYDWLCPDGHRQYQDKGSECLVCKKECTREMLWKAKKRPESNSFCFDSEPHFRYFNEFTKRPGYGGDLTESMSLQGSFFMMTKERYFTLGMNDESWGSWGTQGAEIAARTWLSGGRVLVNHRTWYAHLFRTKSKVFGFPYEQSEKQIQGAKKKFRDLFYTNSWPLQKMKLHELIEKFAPVPGWSAEDLAKLKANGV